MPWPFPVCGTWHLLSMFPGGSVWIFKFFWSGKRDLVARRVVVQPSCLGGFSVVDFQCKVMALHVQWVRRFVSSPSSWVSFMVFWFSSRLAAPPHLVFSAQLCFSPVSLSPFYRSLLTAWRACKGSLTASSLGIGSGIDVCPVSAMSTKSAYLFLLSENAVSPHCEEKFFPLFGSLYWSCTWRQLFFFDLDRPVIDLCWKVSHGVLTRPRGLPVLVLCSFYCLLLFCSCRVSSTSVFALSSGGQCLVVASVYYVLGFSSLSFYLQVGSSCAFWFLG